MTTKSDKRRGARDRARRHRQRMRARGLRPIQIWVPDTRTAAFREEAHRQSLAVARSRHDDDDQAFVDAVAEWNEGRSAEKRGPSGTDANRG